MKKILLAFIFLMLFFTPAFNVHAEEEATNTLIIHYYRYAADYEDWNFWVWPYYPVNAAGSAYNLDTDGTEILMDDFGAYTVINLADTPLSANITAGIIVRKGSDWAEKDISIDRYFNIPATSEGGVQNIYLVQNDSRIGYSIDDPNGPDKSDRVLSAFFQSTQTIRFLATKQLTKDDFVLTVDGSPIDFTYTPDGFYGTITLSTELDLTKNYVLKPTFDGVEKPYQVTFDGIYDSPSFEEAFAYDGDDLGATINNNQTQFRLWAPISNTVTLNLYDTGSPTVSTTGKALPGGTNTPSETIPMTRDVKGTWVTTVNENLHGTYYTYSVTNGDITNEVVDPYAKSAGVNGVRGMVVDFSQVNPAGFEYNDRADNMENPTDAIIYELHVRDLTSHSSWNGTEANRAKYLGLIEEGTTYGEVTTGFDHIKELGVTHVQILPFFDFGVIDEARVNDSDYTDSFNWGYMPINYNVLEGSYSSNPYDGTVRIQEMKEVVTAFTENNIRLNMDVVYNHTGLSSDSNFNLILPGYYHRMTSSGGFSNGSGTGNETASERIMMRKFMVDSLTFWATEYNISGFRFDLMALHDVETMNDIVDALHDIDPSIMVYGEPWNGGTSPLSGEDAARKENLDQMPGVGAFNDDFRDGVKGSVFTASDKGYVQGLTDASFTDRIKYGIVGGIAYSGLATGNLSVKEAWHTSPNKTINYVSCHDNNTLYDKLMQSVSKRENVPLMVKQAGSILFTSQGITFIQAGSEFLRSKPAVGGGYDSNSYQSPDSTNQLRWDLKAQEKNMDVFNYYKGLITLRKAHPAFRMTSAQQIQNNLTFMYQDKPELIGFMIDNNANGDTWERILVVSNSSFDKSITLPSGGGAWHLVGRQMQVGTNVLTDYQPGDSVSVWQYETKIFYQGPVPEEPADDDSSSGGCNFGAAIFFINMIAVASLSAFAINRKR